MMIDVALGILELANLEVSFADMTCLSGEQHGPKIVDGTAKTHRIEAYEHLQSYLEGSWRSPKSAGGLRLSFSFSSLATNKG